MRGVVGVVTIIAWDGTTLAADKQATLGCGVYRFTKIFREGEYLVGFSGKADRIPVFRAWFAAGRDPVTFPDNKDDAESVYILSIHRSGRIERYEQSGHPCHVEETLHAMGSGREYALAALSLRCTAAEAVAVASQFDENCGLGCDELRFGDETAPTT